MMGELDFVASRNHSEGQTENDSDGDNGDCDGEAVVSARRHPALVGRHTCRSRCSRLARLLISAVKTLLKGQSPLLTWTQPIISNGASLHTPNTFHLRRRAWGFSLSV